MKNLIKNTAALILAVAGFSASAQAATVTPAPAVGDLLLGFRVASSGSDPGLTINLEVDLGSASLFYNATPGSTFTLTGLTLADLVGVYGSSWNTRTDLSWGVVGTTYANSDSHSSEDTLWLTKARSNPAVKTTAYNRLSDFSQQGPAGKIATMFQAGSAGTFFGATATSNSARAAQIDATAVGSWTIQENPGSSTFGFNTGGLLDNTTNISSGSFAISDLYELQPGSGAGTYLGSFSLSNSGVLSFTAAPEPSSIALALGSAGLLALRRRRRGTGIA